MKTPSSAGVERETNSLATLVSANPLRLGLGSPARPSVITRNLTIWTSSLDAAHSSGKSERQIAELGKV